MKLIIVFNFLLISVFGQHNNPNMLDKKSAIAHLFEWKFIDIAKECEFLSTAGYGAVQTSPIQEVFVSKRTWWERYQPVSKPLYLKYFLFNFYFKFKVSYKIHSRSGNEEEFKEMVKTCNDLGQKNIIRIQFSINSIEILNRCSSVCGCGI